MRSSLSHTHPELARQWDNELNGALRPSDVSSKSTAVVWWVCDADPPHVWQAAVRSRAGSGSGCPKCSRPQKKLLQDHHPELAREWHPTRNLPLRLEDTHPAAELPALHRPDRHPQDLARGPLPRDREGVAPHPER